MVGVNMGKYFIFSDESGSWANQSDKFYARAWIKVKEEDYLYLEGLWKTKKLPKPSEKSLLRNSNKISDELNKMNFKYFFTFTKLNEFYSRKFYVRDKILESVSLVISQLENQLRSYMRKRIPVKIQDGINQIMFLNVYEAYHIKNAVEILCEQGNEFEFYLDKPQFAENDYLELFNNNIEHNCKAKLIFTHKKEEKPYNLGIYYVDALVSMFRKIINNNKNIVDDYLDYFKNNIFTKSYAGNTGANGFNKIFYPVNKSYGNDELRKEERDLINYILNNLNP